MARLSRKVIVFLVIVVIGTVTAVVTTAMPPVQPKQTSAFSLLAPRANESGGGVA